MGASLSQSQANDHPTQDCECSCRLSIVIPTVNEETRITNCIDSLKSRPNSLGPCMELIVVDGGSTDGTARVARKMGAKLISSLRGRGTQMNVGWKGARRESDWVLFIHADSIVSPRGLHSLMNAITKKKERKEIWGCFKSIDVHFEDSDRSLHKLLIQLGVELRTRVLHSPYGDQGLFIKREALEELGGFKEWPLLEDVEMVSRLNKRSPPIIIDSDLTTSGRRWEKLGLLKTFFLNQVILLGYRVGIDVNTLADLYYSK